MTENSKADAITRTAGEESSSKQATRASLRQQRLDNLLESCREQTLGQVLGTFGLSPAMFADKVGGNVTTQHNADQGIFAQDSEHYERSDYDYQAAKTKKKSEMVKDGSMNSQEFTDAYTGEKARTTRVNGSGKVVMNAELDHTIPLAEAHRDGGWMKDRKGRRTISSEPENLNYTTHENNRKKGGRAATDALSQENGYDEDRVKPIVDKARDAVDKHMPTSKERVVYHGKELLQAGAQEAGKNALRQAMSVLLVEFVNGSYLEISTIVRERLTGENLIDRVIKGLQRTPQRVESKLHDAFDALIAGGAQGFISNLLTFIINTVVTTSAKVVTIIRESLQGLWAALKTVISPVPGTPPMEVARAATKLIATVVAGALGQILHESVKAFLLSIPLLAPLADILSGAVTGILTGLLTALIIYGIDRLFDWLSSTGTELLEAQLAKADADAELAGRLASFIEHQHNQSRQYGALIAGNAQVQADLRNGVAHAEQALAAAHSAYEKRSALTDSLPATIGSMHAMDDELDRLIAEYGAIKQS